MNTLLLLNLSLLYFTEVMGLRCNTCTRTEGWNCVENRGTCIAKENEMCSSTSYYKGGKHLYSEHSCMHKCKAKESTRNDELILTLCCNKNLCNAF